MLRLQQSIWNPAHWGVVLVFLTLIVYSCQKDDWNTDSNFRLGFSNDTVTFDTVFTSIGSSYRILTVRNPGNQRVLISQINLARGKSSPFRINIDGNPTESLPDLEIGANDSAYIFVRVTIDPTAQNNPFIQEDSIVFVTNGNIQSVKLLAYGQNAYFHYKTHLQGDTVFPTDKPHVFYGDFSAHGCNVTLPAGCRLYFHNGVKFEVFSGASLTINGTLEHPVTFSSDRLDDDYNTIPGLWDGIRLHNGCNSCTWQYAEISNASTAVQVDSCGLVSGSGLSLHNCLINNNSDFGLYATASKITATNCQMSNCGGYVFAAENGGSYDFRNCTLARYFYGGLYSCIYLSNYTTDTSYHKLAGHLDKAYFGNCIISGSSQDGVRFDELEGSPFHVSFDHCLVQWDEQGDQKYASAFTGCIQNKDPLFKEAFKNDFSLDSLSPAIDQASLELINLTVPSIVLDRKGVSRLANGLPDMGAYERKKN